MATKIYCAAIDCAFYRNDGRCTAKTVCLSDHSVVTVWDGRQRFQRCKTWQKSQHAAELQEKMASVLKGLGNA